MSKWTPRHRALLDALRADRVGPSLYAGLAGEAAEGTPPRGLLRDWVISMMSDPGWAHLRHVVGNPRAIRQTWDRATEAGWSGRTDHHNALFLEDFAFTHLERGDMDRAEWSWRRCIEAWSRCAQSEYWRELVDTLASDADPSVVAQANRRVLEPPVERLDRALRGALAVESGESRAPDTERAARVMQLARQLAQRNPDAPNSPLQHGAAEMRARLQSTKRVLLTAFERAIEALDSVEDDEDTLVEPFERVRSQFEPLELDDDSAITVVDATVSHIWQLRKLDRSDEDEIFDAMLGAVEPFAERLIEALKAGRALGRQSLAADFLVFYGEPLDDTDEREEVFERALDLCPGHRNASMMLSYVRLRQAHAIIASLSLVPGALGRVPRAGERVKASVRTAHQYVEDAARVFPSNEDLPEYRSDVRELADRLGVELSES